MITPETTLAQICDFLPRSRAEVLVQMPHEVMILTLTSFKKVLVDSEAKGLNLDPVLFDCLASALLDELVSLNMAVWLACGGQS